MTIAIFTESPEVYGRCEHVAAGEETDSVVTVQPTEKSKKEPWGLEMCARCAATLLDELSVRGEGL